MRLSKTKTVIEPSKPEMSRRFTLPPALKYSAFRNFWFGMFGAVGGFQILMFSQLWLMHELTGSPLYLGYVGLANALPAILLNLVGGVLADRVNKKYLIVVTQTMSSLLVFLLGILTLLGVVQVWHVILIALVSGATNAFNQPARQALYPNLIDRTALMSAVALNSTVWQSTRIVAPAIAGWLIALFGTAVAFFFAGICMFAFALVVSLLKVPKIQRKTSNNHPALDLLEGLKFIKDNSIFSFLISMAFFNSFFGMAYITQMPVFARDILDVGAEGQGVLFGISGVGALIATIWLGTAKKFQHKGMLLIGAAILSGLSVAGFALTAQYFGSYLLAGIFMFAIGVFSSIYMISIINSLQMMVPNHMRGRVMGFFGITWNIMPLGGMYAGALSQLIGIPFAIASGGILVMLFAVGPALINKQLLSFGENSKSSVT